MGTFTRTQEGATDSGVKQDAPLAGIVSELILTVTGTVILAVFYFVLCFNFINLNK